MSVWEKIRDFLTDVKLDIPEIMGPVEIDLPGLDPFTLGPIGGFTFEPFKFLKKPIESPDKVTPQAEKSENEKRAEQQPAARQQRSQAAAGVAGGGGGGGGQYDQYQNKIVPSGGGSGEAAIGGGGGAPASSGGAPTATPSGSNMPGGAPPAAGGNGAPGGSVIGVVKGAMAEYGIKNPYTQAALLANIEKESGFKPKSENLNYTSIERIRTVFTRLKKYSDEELQAKAVKNPEGMAELVYGMNDKIGQSMGNKEPGDGWKYRGRGFIQITGKNNYARYGKMIGVDLIGNPDQANDPSIAAKLAAAFVMTGLKGKQDFPDQKSANRAVTQTIGGGGLGLDKGYGAEILAKVDKYSTKYTPAGGTGQPSQGGPMYAAAGGVASGPQSGYPATLHGTEAIVPLDGQSYQSKQAVTAVSKAVSGDQLSQQSADNSMASTGPSVVPVPVPGGGGGGDKQAAPPQKSDNSVKADVRFADDTFNRAISKDFAHPTAFTSVGFA
jgi:predicted chitinase